MDQNRFKENRFEEYHKSRKDAEAYPLELNTMILRLNKRIRYKRRKKYIVGLSSIAALFLLFVITVNSHTTLAEELFKLPVIGSLAEYVNFDKGLQNAIENKYAKKVDLISVDNGYTLGLPYVIADSKRLVVFFQVPEDKSNSGHYYVDISKIVNTTTGKEYEGYYGESNYSLEKVGETKIEYTSIRSDESPIPHDIKIYATLRKESNSSNSISYSEKERFDPSSSTKVEKLGDFVFDLHLGEFPESIVTTYEKDVEVKGQTIRINSVTQYPTGTEISVNIPDDNDSIINGIDFKAIDSTGKAWGNPGGVISVGPDENGNTIYYLEGDYFHSATLNKIQIVGLRLIKKSEATITVDLQNETMSPELKEMHIKSIKKSGNKAYITFSSDTKSGGAFGLFQHEYQDTKGNRYNFHSESSTSSIDGACENNFAVVWPKDDKVILTRSMSPMIQLEKPVEIKLNSKKTHG